MTICTPFAVRYFDDAWARSQCGGSVVLGVDGGGLLILGGLALVAVVNGGVQINLVFEPSLGDRAISRNDDSSRYIPAPIPPMTPRRDKYGISSDNVGNIG